MACSKDRLVTFESILNSLMTEYVTLSRLCEHHAREVTLLRSLVPAASECPSAHHQDPDTDKRPEFQTSTFMGEAEVLAKFPSTTCGHEIDARLHEGESTASELAGDDDSVIGVLDLRDTRTCDAKNKGHSEVKTRVNFGLHIDNECISDMEQSHIPPSTPRQSNRSNRSKAADNWIERVHSFTSHRSKAADNWIERVHSFTSLYSVKDASRKPMSQCERVGIACGMILPILMMLGAQLAALAVWPNCQDGVPCEHQQSQPQLMRSFAQDVVPDLKKYAPNFVSMGQAVGNAPNNDRDCIGPLIGWLHLTLGGFVTNPSTVENVLRHIGIANLTLVRDAMGELLTSQFDYTSLLNVSASCARKNPMLNSYMCAAVDDPSLRPVLLNSDEISISMHLYLVLEKLTNVVRDSSALYSLLGQHFQRTSTDTEAKIVDYSRRAGVSGVLKEFRTQKWHSVELSGAQRLKLKEEPVHAAKYLQYNAMVNILEATRVDHSVGVTNNVDLGLALSADVSTQWPYVDTDSKIIWNLGEDWINAYNAWNLNYVLQFGLSSYIAKLAIPSILCASEPGVATPPGWLPPEPSMWFIARGVSLKSDMAYNADRKWKLREGFKYEFSMSHEMRNRWALISKHQANLPHPPECCGAGSLKAMYDQTLPYNPATQTPTSVLSDEDFLLYTTCLLWATVMVCGFAAEVLIGDGLLTLFGKHGKTYWRSVQLVFPACLTIAIFSQSVMGLPFLWLGLWKGGVPETLGSLMHGITTFRTNRMRAVSSYITAVGLVVHHGATSFIICGVMRGLLPLSRPLACACTIPVLQHLVAPVRYVPRIGHPLYILVEIALEAWFELEVIANLDSFETAHGFYITRMGRGFAITMLLSHWLYLISGAFDILASLLDKANGDDGHVQQGGDQDQERDSFSMIQACVAPAATKAMRMTLSAGSQ